MQPKRSKKADQLLLAERLHSASIHLLRRLRVVDEATGLTAPKLSALSVLVFGGPQKLGQLAGIEQVRPPTMTRVVQELEAAGYVARTNDTKDRRVVHIKATAKGKRLLLMGRSKRTTLLAGWLAELSEQKVRKLHHAVGVLEEIVRTNRL